MKLKLSAAVLFIPLFCGVVFAENAENAGNTDNWPQFKRDSARSGDNPGAKLSLPLARTVAVRFSSPVYASPAVVEGKVYIQDARGNVACVDAGKNKVLWLRPLGGFNNMSSPAVAGGRVYIGSAKGAFYVLSAQTGEVLKESAADGAVLAAPAVAGESVYFGTLNGKLYKTDLDGNIVWTFSGGKTSVTELAARGNKILFFAGDTVTMHYLLEDAGKTCRKIKETRSSEQACPTGGPAFMPDGNYAFQAFDSEYGTFFRNDRVMSVDVSDTRAVPSFRGRMLYRGDKAWRMDQVDWEKLAVRPRRTVPRAPLEWRGDVEFLYNGAHHSSPALSADYLVVGTEVGKLCFIDLNKGDKVRKPQWVYATTLAGKGNGAISSSPAVVDGAVYFGGEDGILYGLGSGNEVEPVDIPPGAPAGPRTKLTGPEWPTAGGDAGYSFTSPDKTIKPPFEVKWRTRIWSTFKAPMLVADGKVFACGRSGLMLAMDADTGEILWKAHQPGVESWSPGVYHNGRLVIARTALAQKDSVTTSGDPGPTGRAGIWCHDAATGNTLWHYPMDVAYHGYADGLSAADNKVIVCPKTPQGVVKVLALDLDTGKVVWEREVDRIKEADKDKYLVRFSAAASGNHWYLSFFQKYILDFAGRQERPGKTFCFDVRKGDIVWRRDDVSILRKSRIAFKNDIVILADRSNAVLALNPLTGETIWSAKYKADADKIAMQPLTDDFLATKGAKDYFAGNFCTYPYFVNGFWLMHKEQAQHGNNMLVAGINKNDGSGRISTFAWSWEFLSNACPSPAIAYGRLFYCPNAEGLVYCFVPAGESNPATVPAK